MENLRLNKVRKIIWGSLSIFFAFVCYIGSLVLCFEGFEKVGFVLSIVSLLLFAFFFFMLMLENKYYKLKYFFLGKNFNNQIEESLSKFKNIDEEFKKKFVKTCKPVYRRTGKIFYDDAENNYSAWIFKDKKNIDRLELLYVALLSCIKNKKGFVGFCKRLERTKFSSSWEIFSYFDNDLCSNELRYLLGEVYALCEFNVADNGLSESFTKQNNQNIKILDDIYSPILFGFRKEITAIVKKIKLENKDPKTEKKVKTKKSKTAKTKKKTTKK